MTKNKVVLSLFLILLLGAFFRFYQITEIPPGLYPDEAMNGNNALEALATGHFKVFYPENNGREGLFINLQAISLWFFGNEPWALRLVSAFFGTLTILALFLLTKELFGSGAAASLAALDRRAGMAPERGEGERGGHVNSKSSLGILNGREDAAATLIAFLSSLFLASSFWHINFSRIGFRAIMVPFLATFGIYFLLKGLRRGTVLDLVWAGIFIGLGFHTYIAFRFMPFALLVPIVWYLWRWKKKQITHCIPCVALLFIFVALVTALPLGFYFLQNPQDFLGRAGDVSIFSAASPLKEFIKSNISTIGMFFVRGDCNWRHNFNCQPQLNPLVALFFIVGIAVLVRSTTSYKLQATSLFAWLFFMSLPATLTREGLPHALRSIGLIPPVMILSGFGAWWIYQKIIEWLEKQKIKWPNRVSQLERIKREVFILSALILLLIPVLTYRQYFVRWASSENTHFAFSTDLWHLGKFLDALPQDTKKYVVVNLPGVYIRGMPAPAQTVMFATDSFRDSERERKNIEYVLPQNINNQLLMTRNQQAVIAFLNGEDRNLILDIQKKFPSLKIRVPGDFVILEKY